MKKYFNRYLILIILIPVLCELDALSKAKQQVKLNVSCNKTLMEKFIQSPLFDKSKKRDKLMKVMCPSIKSTCCSNNIILNLRKGYKKELK